MVPVLSQRRNRLRKAIAAGGGGSTLLTKFNLFWALDEASGDAVDEYGVANATAINAPGATTGKIDGARSLSRASSQYFRILSPPAVLTVADNDWFFSVWVKPASFSATHVIASKSSFVSASWLLFCNSSGVLMFNAYASSEFGGGTTLNTGDTLSTGNWHHVLAWHDKTDNAIRTRLNNGTVRSAAFAGGTYSGSDPFNLSEDGFGDFWNGDMDMAGFGKDALLDTSEQDALWNSGNGITHPF